jgi:Ca-activated chloride channel homolog
MDKEENFYTRLGLPFNATPEEIRRAFREAALRLHPDTNVEVGATELFLGVKEAYNVLSDASLRSEYDSKLSPEATSDPELTTSTLYSVTSLQRIGNPQLVYLLLDLENKIGVESKRPHPINLCLVIDTSSSMQGQAMDTLKAGAIELIRQARPHDTISVVCFNDWAQVLVPASRHLDPSQAETRIQMLQPGGGTEIFQGLEAGFNETRRYLSPNNANHIILITDGRTYGDEAACYYLANQAVSEGIVIDAIGIGNKWNDVFLDNLAVMTGGSCMYVIHPQDLHHFLSSKLAGVSKNYAERVAYHFNPSQGVSLSYAMRMHPDIAPLENQPVIQLGSIPGGSRLTVLFEFLNQGIISEGDVFTLASGKLSMDIPSKIIPKHSIPLNITRAIGGYHMMDPLPSRLVEAVARMTVYRMQERARKDAASGRLDAAQRTLQYIAMNLMSKGNRELAQTVMKEIATLEEKQDLSEEGKKQIKFGTRVLTNLHSGLP